MRAGVAGGRGGAPRGGRGVRDRRARRGEDQGPTVVGPQGGLDVHGGGAGGRLAPRVGGGVAGGPVAASGGPAPGAGRRQRRTSIVGPGRRSILDPDLVRGVGDLAQGDDRVLVASPEALL